MDLTISSDLSNILIYDESVELESAAMELSAAPEALVTVRAARDRMRGKSERKGETDVAIGQAILDVRQQFGQHARQIAQPGRTHTGCRFVMISVP